MRTREYWEEYERRKAEFQNIGLSPREYQLRINALVEELDARPELFEAEDE